MVHLRVSWLNGYVFRCCVKIGRMTLTTRFRRLFQVFAAAVLKVQSMTVFSLVRGTTSLSACYLMMTKVMSESHLVRWQEECFRAPHWETLWVSVVYASVFNCYVIYVTICVGELV